MWSVNASREIASPLYLYSCVVAAVADRACARAVSPWIGNLVAWKLRSGAWIRNFNPVPTNRFPDHAQAGANLALGRPWSIITRRHTAATKSSRRSCWPCPTLVPESVSWVEAKAHGAMKLTSECFFNFPSVIMDTPFFFFETCYHGHSATF